MYGLGESLGGAVLIESLAVEPRFNAIVAESPFASLERVARERVAQKLPLSPALGRALAAPIVWAPSFIRDCVVGWIFAWRRLNARSATHRRLYC